MREDAGHSAGDPGPWGRTQQKVWEDGDEQRASPHLGPQPGSYWREQPLKEVSHLPTYKGSNGTRHCLITDEGTDTPEERCFSTAQEWTVPGLGSEPSSVCLPN